MNTVRLVHEALSQEIITTMEDHMPNVQVINFLLNCGHRAAPPEYQRGWRAVEISTGLLPYVPLLLTKEVCNQQPPPEERNRYIRDNGCAPMTIMEHLKTFARVKVKREHPETLSLILQHIALHQSYEDEDEVQEYMHMSPKFHKHPLPEVSCQ